MFDFLQKGPPATSAYEVGRGDGCSHEQAASEYYQQSRSQSPESRAQRGHSQSQLEQLVLWLGDWIYRSRLRFLFRGLFGWCIQSGSCNRHYRDGTQCGEKYLDSSPR